MLKIGSKFKLHGGARKSILDNITCSASAYDVLSLGHKMIRCWRGRRVYNKHNK